MRFFFSKVTPEWLILYGLCNQILGSGWPTGQGLVCTASQSNRLRYPECWECLTSAAEEMYETSNAHVLA